MFKSGNFDHRQDLYRRGEAPEKSFRAVSKDRTKHPRGAPEWARSAHSHGQKPGLFKSLLSYIVNLRRMFLVELPSKFHLVRVWLGDCHLAHTNLGQSPNQGHSPLGFLELNGEAQPRLTSDGEAGAEETSLCPVPDFQDGISHPAAKPKPTSFLFVLLCLGFRLNSR
jgi:hypothetical protein